LYRAVLLALVGLCACEAQLFKWGDRIPRRAKPPVLFVTGHDAVCPDARSGELPFLNLTFGKFDEIMHRDGRVSLVFEACYAPNRPPIEDIAALLGKLLGGLVYEDGQPVPQVDVVAHSMGGLIVRSYLAGKQSGPGLFSPLAAPRIRKSVFIGTPHFGTSVAGATDNDPQLREMSPASGFLFDLAAWNQGRDDLRGVDALSIVGTAGSNGERGFTDSVVVLTSGSLGFVTANRTLVLPLCHTAGGIGALLLCNGAAGLARVSDESHPTARAVLSFLNGTAEWQFIGQPAAQNPLLATVTSFMAQLRTALDEPMAARSAVLRLAGQAPLPLTISTAGFAYAEKVPAGRGQIELNGYSQDVELRPGVAQAIIVKPGPLISAVEPVSGSTWPLVLAPGMRVIIKGSRLIDGDAEVTLNETVLPVTARDIDSLTVVLPERVAGLMTLKVKTRSGQHSTGIYIEASMPVLFKTGNFAAALHAGTARVVTPESPAEPAEIVSLFLTGLGDTTAPQPIVTINGEQCIIIYAGRAPGLPGIDQVNCQLPVTARGPSTVTITSGIRRSSAVLPIQ
jgi:uncharacterized protein (TIGR03437 family)